MLFAPYVMGRLESIWGPDALEYKPARWALKENAATSQYRYPVFNGGPRLCLGVHLATFEAVAVLASVLPRFRFELLEPPGKDASYAISLTLAHKGGLRARVHERT